MKKCLYWLFVLTLAIGGSGCETFKEHSLTVKLWQKDPTGSETEHLQGDKYIYGPATRATLTPFAVVGDATVVGIVLGAGLVVTSFAAACQSGAQSGGRVVN